MVSEEVIAGTIKRMLDSGIDRETIARTLKDIGLSDSEISHYISVVTGVPEQKPVRMQQDDANATQELLHTTTHNKLEEHSDKLDSMHQDVSGLREKIDGMSKGPGGKELLSQITLVNQRLSGLEKQVSDLKAMNSSLKSLLEKILETNRRIVEKL